MTENQPYAAGNQPSVISVALKYGLLTGVLYVVFAFINFLTESYGNFFITLFVSLVISVTGIVLAMREFKKLNNGYMTFVQGLGLGMIVSVIAGIISGLFNLIYVEYIDPSITEKIIDASIEQMAAFGVDESVLDEQRDKILAEQTPFKQFTSALSNAAFGGLILSLIISAIMKHKHPEFE